MQFDQTLATAVQPDDPQHDPAGDAIQCHELPTGEMLLTFNDTWCADHDYQAGDVISFNIDEETGKLSIVNQSHIERMANRAPE